MESIGLAADSNVLEKPTVKEAVEDVGDPHWNLQLAPDEAMRFRALLVLSQDTADVQYAAKKACRHVAALTGAAWGKLKRLVRSLLQFPRLSWKFKRDECDTDTVDAFSRLRLVGMCPYSAIHVRGRRHRREVGDKALELDAGDGGPLEWRGGVSGLARESASRRLPVIWSGRCVLSSISIPVFSYS